MMPAQSVTIHEDRMSGEAPRSRRFCTVGVLVGTLFLAVSLTPSLVPRSVLFQGLVRRTRGA
jgi:uncharacterized membrane protein